MKPHVGACFSSPLIRLVQIAFALVARDHGTGPARPATQAGTVATQGIRFRARHRDTRGGEGYVPRPVSTGGYAPRDFRLGGPVRLRFRVGSRLVQRPVLTRRECPIRLENMWISFIFFMRACACVRACTHMRFSHSISNMRKRPSLIRLGIRGRSESRRAGGAGNGRTVDAPAESPRPRCRAQRRGRIGHNAFRRFPSTLVCAGRGGGQGP